MKKSLFAAAALVTALGAQAAPVVVTIDDFSIAQGPVTDTSADAAPVVDTLAGVRTIAVNALSTSLAPITNQVSVTGGILDISNGVGDIAEVIVSWELAAGLVPAGATQVKFSALVLESDPNPTSISFALGGTTLLTAAIPGSTFNEMIGFDIDPALITAGGLLTMRLVGASGWDLGMDTFGISYEQAGPVSVPEPASLALVGLALAGAGFASSRRKV